jgi:hypothetical protein
VRHLVAHHDPLRYPQINTPQRRFELFHLDRLGSEQLTRDFARQFLTLTAAERER